MTDDLDDSMRRLTLRLNLLEDETIADLKSYFRRMWMITSEMESAAVAEFTRLSSQARVRRNITEYVEHGTFPWDRRGRP